MIRKSGKRWVILLAICMAFCMALVFTACGKNASESEARNSFQEAENNQVLEEIEKTMIMPKDLGTTKDLNSFATIDLYGNPVGNEIFSEYKYTIVDVWGTYCSPCIRSMPDMKAVYDKYKDKGVNVVGIVIDVQAADRSPMPEMVQTARTIVETQNADFTHMLLPTNLLYSFMEDIQSIPTQFLVDSEGDIVSKYFKGGKDFDRWSEFLDEKLEKLER